MWFEWPSLPHLIDFPLWVRALTGAMFGLILGSLVSALSFRLPRGIGVGFTRSHCPVCHTILQPLNLVPLFSYWWQRGKCHACGTPVPSRYPLIEALTSLLVLLVALQATAWPVFLVHCLLVVVIVTLCVIDLESQRQPLSPWLIWWGAVALLLLIQPATKPAGYLLAGLAAAGAAMGYGASLRPATQSLWLGQVPIGLALALFNSHQLLLYFSVAGVLLLLCEYLYQEDLADRRQAVSTLSFSWLLVLILGSG